MIRSKVSSRWNVTEKTGDDERKVVASFGHGKIGLRRAVRKLAELVRDDSTGKRLSVHRASNEGEPVLFTTNWIEERHERSESRE